MSDIVERLHEPLCADGYKLRREAADEIERLRDQDNAWITTVRKQEEELVRLRSIRATTIEECAQIADEWYGSRMNESPVGALIRALKEQK